ncbi:MAG: ABC transporter permease [Candidatus Roizmanbacteria bacterium]|nr:ABC transporter permease [Candidatus Roizmanbacteria bacterium]
MGFIRSAFFDFSRNKGRTFLTSLGILIGVMAVVLLTAFGLGLRAYIEQQFEDLGSNLIRVVPGQILKNGSFSNTSSAFMSIQFDEKDVQKLDRIREVELVIPVYSRSIITIVAKNKETSTLYASTEGVFVALNLKAEYGRLFNAQDVSKRAKVIVIGANLAENLFSSRKQAIGQSVKIEGQKYTVIGVVNKKGGGFGGPDFDSFTYMPYKTAYTLNTNKTFMAIILQAKSDQDTKSIIRQAEDILVKRYDKDEFSVIQQEELLSAINSIFSIINTVLVAIAAISLLVGGIGIMNIMYVTVTERIKEIGIRRALGARKSDILIQFLVASIILSLIGGITGLGLSYLIVLAIQTYFPAYIDLNSVMLALGVSSAIGIIFGVFPAKKAADLSPIDAIRYE